MAREAKNHSKSTPSPTGGTQVKDRYKFFGEVALEKRFVTTEQLYKALTMQARAKVESGDEKLLGQILLEQGYMTADQIREVLDVLYPPPREDDR
jgi:hypothetical protein